MRNRSWRLAAGLALGLGAGLGAGASPGLAAAPAAPSVAPVRASEPGAAPASRGWAPGVRLVDATAMSGVRFRHQAGRSAEKHLPETMGGGVALLDFDADGDLDLYFVQSGPVRLPDGAQRPRSELWRNDGGFRFSRVPHAGGAEGSGLGQGACVGDIDADGDPDLFVTQVGPDALFVNDGGRFRAAADSGISDAAWGTSCTFIDVDGDAHLDLYVTNYVDWDATAKNPTCGEAGKRRVYCHPSVFTGTRDTLWLGDGRGRFRDGSAERGLAAATGKGLGVVIVDPDADGDPDLYVANDSTPNFLWRNDGKGAFRDIALAAGAAVDEQGRPQGSMGIVAGDVNADGLEDLFVTNLDLEGSTLYLGSSRAPRITYRDASAESGLEAPSLPMVGFGDELQDFDLDGDLDLLVTNGHVLDNIREVDSSRSHSQPPQLFANDGRGRFTLVEARAFPAGSLRLVGRGLAAGDLDGDGDLDAVVTSNDGEALLLRNEGAEKRPWIAFDLRGVTCHRDALGARVLLRVAGKVVAERVLTGARSYLSDGTRRMHFGLPSATSVDVEIRWPFGATQTFKGLSPRRVHLLTQSPAP